MTEKELKTLEQQALQAAIDLKDIDTILHFIKNIQGSVTMATLVSIIRQGDDLFSKNLIESLPYNNEQIKRELEHRLTVEENPFLYEDRVATLRTGYKVPENATDKDIRLAIHNAAIEPEAYGRTYDEQLLAAMRVLKDSL